MNKGKQATPLQKKKKGKCGATDGKGLMGGRGLKIHSTGKKGGVPGERGGGQGRSHTERRP